MRAHWIFHYGALLALVHLVNCTSTFQPALEANSTYTDNDNSTFQVTLPRTVDGHRKIVLTKSGGKPETSPRKCPNKFTLELNVCVQEFAEKPGQRCPADFTSIQKKCRKEATPVCPSGMVNEENECRRKCTKGYIFQNSICTEPCPPNTKRLYNNICISTEISCPKEYNVSNGKCQLTTCPSGYNTTEDSCIEIEPFICPLGYNPISNLYCESCAKFSSDNKTCLERDVVCPPGLFNINTKTCSVSCPTNFAFFEDRCLAYGQEECPQHFLQIDTAKDNACNFVAKCPGNMRQERRQCLPPLDSKTRCNGMNKTLMDGECVQQCPPNYFEMSGECYQDESSVNGCPKKYLKLGESFCISECPLNFVAKDEECKATPLCEKNEYHFENKCVKKCPRGYKPDSMMFCEVKNTCPKNKFFHNGSCIDLPCPRGHKLDFKNRICRRKIACPNSMRLLRDYCVKTCPLNHEPLYGRCLKTTQCPRGFVELNARCVLECDKGYSKVDGKCVKLFDNRCTGINMVPAACESSTNCNRECVCKIGYHRLAEKKILMCIPNESKFIFKSLLDVIFVIDGSSDVDKLTFQMMRIFLINIISQFDSTLDKHTVMASILYGPKNPVMNYLYQKVDMLHYVANLSMPGGNESDLSNTLFLTKNVLLKSKYGARFNVPKLVYILSGSSITQQEKHDINPNLKAMKDNGDIVVFIAVGSNPLIESGVISRFVPEAEKLPSLVNPIQEQVSKQLERQCPIGFKLNGTNCTDINECDSRECHFSAQCLNTPGSFICYCGQGKVYENAQMGCVKEAKENNVTILDNRQSCERVSCAGKAKCSARFGFPVCECEKGYQYSPPTGCIDINECLEKPCIANATCVNNNGSFHCDCQKGLRYSKHFGCIDINECLQNTTVCTGNAACHNTLGSYKCVCKPGFRYNDASGCSDIDECQQQPCKGTGVTCINTPGSYKCKCGEGLIPKKESLADTDDCEPDVDQCRALGAWACKGSLAKCVNHDVGYSCKCPEGYTYNNIKGCIVNAENNFQSRVGNLVLLIDASDAMGREAFKSVHTLVQSLFNLFRKGGDAFASVEFSLMYTGQNEVLIPASRKPHEETAKTAKSMEFLGGESDLARGFNAAAEILSDPKIPITNRLLAVVTATGSHNESTLNGTLQSEIQNATELSQIMIMDVSPEGRNYDNWASLLNRTMFASVVSTVPHHSLLQASYGLIYREFIEELYCPKGWTMVNNVCQIPTSLKDYCSFKGQLYKIGTTVVQGCITYHCTSDGMKEGKILARGIDGMCYHEDSFFPCILDGVMKWRCRVVMNSNHSKALVYHAVAYTEHKMVISQTTKCLFPFRFKELWHYTCATHNGRKWCSHRHIHRSGSWSWCKLAIGRQNCISQKSGNHYSEGKSWIENCSIFRCSLTGIHVTPMCTKYDGSCVAINTEDYKCVVRGVKSSKCICTTDVNGLGTNEIVEEAVSTHQHITKIDHVNSTKST